MGERVSSVQWRIMTRLLPVLGLVFVVVLYWVGEALKQTLYSANLELARDASTMAVNAVEAAMAADETGHPDWGTVAAEIVRDDDIGIQIINTRGEVLFSTDPARRGTTYRLSDSSCVVCHQSGARQASSETTFFRDPENTSYQVYAAPLINTGECATCHAEDGQKLGMVFVQQSLAPVNRRIRTVQIGVAIAGVVALLLTVVTIRVLLGRYLGRPLRRLVAGARALGTGDLQHTVEVSDRTELAELADTLNASTRRLSELQKELLGQARLAGIGETVAGLAHCLKNTLNALRAGQYVIDRGVERNDPDKFEAGWRVMKDGIRQVERLTGDLLYCVKERTPERDMTDVGGLIREVADLMQEAADEKGVELRTVLDDTIGSVPLDRTLVYRALLNLVTNAVEACSESESGSLVTVTSRNATDEIVLAVEDNGVGMSEETLSQLFNRFFSTKASGGTGLGLPVAKKVAEEHGGRLEVRSAEGKGSTFALHLPKSAARA